MENKKYSFLMAVYKKDNPEWLKVAIDSMVNQTIPPDEIVIGIDGPIGIEIANVIYSYETLRKDLFSVYRFERNEGHGLLLRKTIPLCRNEYIARMDADDYSLPERIEKQLKKFDEDSNIGVVGCSVYEFIDEINNVVSLRKLPENHDEIVKFSKKRCPIAHPSAVYRKQDVIACGNYEEHFWVEDYDIFVKLLKYGVKSYNFQDPLVYMRIDKNFYRRRGGVKYLKSLLTINKKLYKIRWTSFSDYLIRSTLNIIVCLLPNALRDFIYRNFLRG